MTDPSQPSAPGAAAVKKPDFTQANDPFVLFELWFADAETSEINDPNAMAVATVDDRGMPNVRTVLMKGFDDAGHPERGFVFYTNTQSAKGRELLASGKAALLFHWKSRGRQVRVRGAVACVTQAEADAYFASRPRGSRIGAWASDQSRPLDSRAILEARVAEKSAELDGEEVPRPEHWTGFRVTPSEIEFWQAGDYRLHDRVVFRQSTFASDWTRQRLYP